MRGIWPGRPRSLADTAMLVVVTACVGIALVRVVLVIAVVPYSVYLDRSEAAASATHKASVPLMERIAKSGPFESWWGGRWIPRPVGGSYLGVLSNTPAERIPGFAIGWIAEHDRANGVRIDRIVVPTDRVALLGEESGTLMTKADGSQVRTAWAPLSRHAAYFTGIPIVEKDYDPVLSAGQAAQLASGGRLVERATAFFVGTPGPGDSGTWILLAKPAERREYYLVPVEASPVGGVL